MASDKFLRAPVNCRCAITMCTSTMTHNKLDTVLTKNQREVLPNKVKRDKKKRFTFLGITRNNFLLLPFLLFIALLLNIRVYMVMHITC